MAFEPIVIRNYPYPPSENAMYATIRKGNKTWRTSSRELMEYKRRCNTFYLLNKETMKRAQEIIREWVKLGYGIELDALIFMEYQRFLTKEGQDKKVDVSNRIKGLHDTLSELLKVDDHKIYKMSAEKIVAKEESFCDLIIRPVKRRHLDEVTRDGIESR